jgi:hypothetical protein
VTRAMTPAVLSGREGGGGRRSADAVLPGQEGSDVRLKREVTINMLLGGGGRVTRRGGGGGDVVRHGCRRKRCPSR